MLTLTRVLCVSISSGLGAYVSFLEELLPLVDLLGEKAILKTRVWG
jgi:hypothetical protein